MPILRPVKKCHFVKWLHPRFYEAVADLECHSCEKFWTFEDIRRVMAKTYTNGYVMTDLLKPMGFIVFTRREQQGKIINLVTHSDYRRSGWGTMLLDRAKKRLVEEDGCTELFLDLRESNTAAQLFFKKNGFVATSVRRAFFKDEYQESTEFEDAFRFSWRP